MTNQKYFSVAPTAKLEMEPQAPPRTAPPEDHRRKKATLENAGRLPSLQFTELFQK